jgi:hypothetical protein
VWVGFKHACRSRELLNPDETNEYMLGSTPLYRKRFQGKPVVTSEEAA